MPDSKLNDASADAEFARLVVEQKLAMQEEVQRCLDLHDRLVAEGRPRPLGDLLVEAGAITGSQLARLRKNMEETRGAQQIPGYRIESKLGSGAMAHVYKARQLSLDRVVAIKILPRQLSENAEYVERFYKEGKAAAKLNHANIVQAIDVGEAGGYHYFVMEYVEGHTLYDELAWLPGRDTLRPGDVEMHKTFSEQEALRTIIQIARALEHAHKQGLIHRDVKPKNIMITKDGMAKLADMGLARVAADAEAAQAEAGRAFGTPYYISPEQIRGEVDIDFRADIYSLGATLYHLVTGRVPFDGPTPAAVMHKHLKEPLVPPDHINTGLSAGIGEVVEVMMAKDRNERYASTSDLLLDLEAIQAGEPPLQARRQIDAKVLKGLAAEAEPVAQPAAPKFDRDAMSVVVILGAALAVSIIVNILFLVLLARHY
jgi:serine/threonine-protein kinase